MKYSIKRRTNESGKTLVAAPGMAATIDSLGLSVDSLLECSQVGGDEGSSILEVALVAPLMLLLLAGAVDIGRAYFYAIEVSSAAEAGALYGAQNPTDLSGMVSAARLDASGITQINPSASYGCECSDGSSASAACTSVPVCSANIVTYVEVDTAYSYTPILGFPGILSSFLLTAHARVHASY